MEAHAETRMCMFEDLAMRTDERSWQSRGEGQHLKTEQKRVM